MAELAPERTDWGGPWRDIRLPAPRARAGREQRGARYAAVVQAEEFLAL